MTGRHTPLHKKIPQSFIYSHWTHRVFCPPGLWHEYCITVDRETFTQENFMGRGSAGNVIAALCSFFIPGLGQLLQGRWLLAGFMFVMSVVLWVILLGWVIHLWSIIDAAIYDPPARYRSYRHRRGYDW